MRMFLFFDPTFLKESCLPPPAWALEIWHGRLCEDPDIPKELQTPQGFYLFHLSDNVPHIQNSVLKAKTLFWDFFFSCAHIEILMQKRIFKANFQIDRCQAFTSVS